MSTTLVGALLAADAIPVIDAITLPLTGIAIGVGLGLTAEEVLRAHQASHEKLSDQPAAKPCVDCAEAIPCFETPEGQSPKEMGRQLKEQQDKINEQTPEDMQKRLDEADARKQSTGTYRPEGDAAARVKAREEFQDNRISELREKYREAGLTRREAAEKAAAQTAQDMAGMDATHELDSIVGGAAGDNLTLANRSINRSIGSQWKSRIKALKKAVKQAIQRGDKKMDVQLEPCEEEPTS